MLQKSDLDFENVSRIVNLPDPLAAQQPATKAYVDSAVEGLAWKDSVRVRTTANISLASPGATIDGITMAAGDRFLADGQTTASQKGVYIWNGAAVAATRAPDSSVWAEIEQAVYTVEEGTSADASYRQTVVNGTMDTTTPTFALFGSSAGAASETSAGIAEIATQAETNTGTDDVRFVTPLKLATYSGLLKRYATTIGDGTATQYDVTHNLGSTDVHVQVFRISDGATVQCDQTRTSTTVVRLNFAAAVAASSLRVLVVY